MTVNNISATTDETLITAAQNGDKHAQQQLLDRYAPLLGKWSTRPVFHGRYDDARSVLTQALILAVKRYDPSRNIRPCGYFASCIRFAAQNYGKQLLRRHTREVLTDRPVAATVTVPDTPETTCLQTELRHRLRHALHTLTPRQYAVLTALYYGHLSRADTAALLGCTPQAVSDTHRRALCRLRTALQEE